MCLAHVVDLADAAGTLKGAASFRSGLAYWTAPAIDGSLQLLLKHFQ